MTTFIVATAENASALSHWIDVATLAASVTAPIAMIIALAQYVSTNRATARAHMHAVFRDYLAFRASVPKERESHIVGYRYYAMEEAFYWIKRQRRIRNPASWMKKSEKAAWLETVKHHIEPDKGGAGHRYFSENRQVFGDEFQKFCEEVLGPYPVPVAPAPMPVTEFLDPPAQP